MTLYNDTDTSLLGTFGNGVNNHLLDTPDYTPGCDLQDQSRPAKGDAFNTRLLQRCRRSASSATRRAGSSTAPASSTPTSRCSRTCRSATRQARPVPARGVQRVQHAQFYGAGAVDGNISSSTFGQIVRAAPPRLVQLAVKYLVLGRLR